jgi:hypothetical protein
MLAEKSVRDGGLDSIMIAPAEALRLLLAPCGPRKMPTLRTSNICAICMGGELMGTPSW